MKAIALAGTLALMGLAACSSGGGARGALESGVGFGDYQSYLRARSQAPVTASGSRPYSVPPETTREPTRGAIAPPAAMPGEAPRTVDAIPQRRMPPPPVPAAPVAPAPQISTLPAPAPAPAPSVSAGRPLTAIAAQPVQPQPQPVPMAAIQPQSSTPGASVRHVTAGAGFGTTPAFDSGDRPRGISDEQDFDAVSSRETIESDRERLARQREQYQVIQVTSVPGAEVSGGPNLMAFALSMQHAPGTEVYRRMNPLRWRSWQDNCLAYRTQEAAQEAFLAAGGPERDRENLDPDGDGYACWWDPTPIRQAMARN